MRTMSEGQGTQNWLSLEPALIQILRSPSMDCAMQKILGPDYQIAAPWCNRDDQGGMMGYHIIGAENCGNDQHFHKDGTGLELFVCEAIPAFLFYCTLSVDTALILLLPYTNVQTTATRSQQYATFAVVRSS